MSKKTKQPTQLQPEPKPKITLDGQYPGLNFLSWLIGYLEQFLAIISEPLLIGASALAIVDFLTGSGLLRLPAISYAWAGSIGIATSACFIVTWRRAIKAFTLNLYGPSLLLALLGLALGFADWTAIDVQSLQQVLNISGIQALSQLNLSIVLITHIRAAVAISMAVVVALSNHTAVTTAQAPKRKLAFVEQWMNKIAPVVSSDTAQPAQPGAQDNQVIIREAAQPEHPLLNEHAQSKQELSEGIQQPAHLRVINTHLEQVPIERALAPIERVRQALAAQPDLSDRALGRSTGMAAQTAKRLRAQVEQERSEAI